jgi:hypothetical protein
VASPFRVRWWDVRGYNTGMRETDLYMKFAIWMRKNRPAEPWCCELKMVKGKSFAFSSVLDHQVMSLTMAQSGITHKLPDAGLTRKPFDIFWTGVHASKSYIIPVFYIPRKQCTGYLIPINDFVKLRTLSPKESVREEELDFPKIEL